MLLLLQERPGSQPGHAAAERGAHGFPGRAVRGVVVDGAAAGGRSRWGLAWGVGRPHGSLLLCRWPITPLVCVMCAARLRRGLCCREGVPCGVLLQSAGPPQSAALGASSTRADHVRGACRLGANAEHRRGRGGGGGNSFGALCLRLPALTAPVPPAVCTAQLGGRACCPTQAPTQPSTLCPAGALPGLRQVQHQQAGPGAGGRPAGQHWRQGGQRDPAAAPAARQRHSRQGGAARAARQQGGECCGVLCRPVVRLQHACWEWF
jgi:hypothetical protein